MTDVRPSKGWHETVSVEELTGEATRSKHRLVSSPQVRTPSQFMMNKVPEVTFAFWVIKIAATTVGETGGDALSMPITSATRPVPRSSSLFSSPRLRLKSHPTDFTRFSIGR